MQQAGATPALHGGEHAWQDAREVALAAGGDAEGLETRPPTWEVRRLEHTQRFALARLA
jgi:hypothetical protein